MMEKGIKHKTAGEEDARYWLQNVRCKFLSYTVSYRASCTMNSISRITRHDSERGIALVMVLVVATIALAIMAGLIYMVTSGTQASAIQKRYKTALEAAIGSKDAMYDVIRTRGNPEISTSICNETWSPTCENDKLNKSTANWNSACDGSLVTGPSSYDMTCTLGSYTAYTKIVDTVEGNSGPDLGLIKGGVVNSNPGEINVMSIPYLYSIEIDSENPSNPSERAKLSVLYQY